MNNIKEWILYNEMIKEKLNKERKWRSDKWMQGFWVATQKWVANPAIVDSIVDDRCIVDIGRCLLASHRDFEKTTCA
jgi:hypothetical protein